MDTRHVGSVDYAWDFYGCRGDVLSLPAKKLEKLLVEDVRAAGFTLIDHVFHRFGPDGAISFLALIEESHVAIHGAPENGKLLEITIHTCIVEGTFTSASPEKKKERLFRLWAGRFSPEKIDSFPERRRGAQLVAITQEED